MTTEQNKQKIPLPEEVVPWKGFIFTGGLDAENLRYRLENEPHLSQTNSIVFAMAIQMEAQIDLIKRLLKAGKLPKEQV